MQTPLLLVFVSKSLLFCIASSARVKEQQQTRQREPEHTAILAAVAFCANQTSVEYTVKTAYVIKIKRSSRTRGFFVVLFVCLFVCFFCVDTHWKQVVTHQLKQG